MAINEVIVNGERVLSTRGDTVSPDNLATGETAHNRAGEPIVGQMGGDSDAYRITDPIGNIDNNDYIPFNDVSDPQQPKKKTPLSALLEKLGKAFLPSKGDRFDLDTASDTVDYQSTDIDGAFGDNNVTGMRYPSTMNILDRMKRIIMRTEAVVNPNGKIGWKSYVKNYDTDGNVVGQKGMQYHMDKSGNLEYQIDDFNAFRAAIQTVDQLGTEIPADSDLNDYMTAGTYRVPDDTTAADIENLPLALCGKIVVLDNGNGGLEQVYFPNHEPRIFVRSYWNSSWGDWKELELKNAGDVYALITGANIIDPDTFRKNIKTVDQMGTEIPANADLNDYTTAGTYQCELTATARTMSNMPYTGDYRIAFKLIVIQGRFANNKIQFYIPYGNDNNSLISYRFTDNNGSTWSDWQSTVKVHANTVNSRPVLEMIASASNNKRSIFKFNQIDNHVIQNFYDGTNWGTEKQMANFEDIYLYSQYLLDVMNISGRRISRTDDLDNFVNAGTYQYSHDNNGLPANCPFTNIHSFKLIVDRYSSDSRSEIMQRITMQNIGISGVASLDWYRARGWAQTTWSPWKQLICSDDIPEISPSAIGNGYAVGTVSGTAITATITGFKLQAGVIVMISLANSIPIGATLNISSTGAKTIRWWGDNAVRAGDSSHITNGVFTFMYDGTYYRIISVDRTPSLGYESYVANTSGKIAMFCGVDQNAFALKYSLTLDKLVWNYFKNSAWRGDVTIADYDDILHQTLGIAIPNNSNFDDYQTQGVYGVSQNAGAATITNCPVPFAGKLIVTKSASNRYVSQVYIGFFKGQGTVYRRSIDTGATTPAWTVWERYTAEHTFIGTCATAANQKDKVATVDNGFILTKGVRISIKFTNTNTYNSQTSSPVTLNVNNTGAKNIWYWQTHSGAGNTGTNTTAYGVANRYTNYYYDGTYWVWDGQSGDNDSDIRPSAYCDTAAGTAAKTAVCTNYSLLSNSYLHVLIRYANTSAGALTFNVNGQGAKPIYINGAASSASNYTLPAGTYLVYYNGTNFYFRTDGNMQTNNNLISLLDNEGLFFQQSYVSGTSGNYGINIHFNVDKNDRAQFKITGVGALNYNYRINSTWKGDGLIFNKWFPNIAYCTSSTEAATAAKVATTQGGGKVITLFAGLVVCVVHSVNNTASNCTLNVDGTGAKQVWYNQAVFTGSTDWICGRQNMAIYYMYDGTYWRWMNMGRMDNSTGFVPNNNNGTITVNSSSPYLVLKSSIIDIKESNNGVTGTSYPAYIIEDKNNYNMSRLETVVETNGNISTYLQVRNYKTADGTTPNGGIKVTMDKEANVTYSLTNPHKFNAALGTGYGTCDTAADQQIKVVTLTNFVLSVGAKVCVKFTNTNSFNSQTSTPVQLNVNNTGAKNIWYNTTHSGAGNTGTNTRIYGEAGRIFTYMYDGTYWVWLGCGYEADTVDPRVIGIGYGTCNTAAATAAKVVTLASYSLRTGGYVTVKFDYDVPANATMNINSRGAKNIYYRGVAITAGLIRGGDRATFIYNGSQYDLIGIDRDDVFAELSQTLAANATTVTFTGLPTSGNVIYDVYTSKAGLNYKSMDDSTSGQLKITFDAQSAAVTVYLRYQWIG